MVEMIKRAFADEGFRYGVVAGFAVGTTVYCGIFSILFHIGTITT